MNKYSGWFIGFVFSVLWFSIGMQFNYLWLTIFGGVMAITCVSVCFFLYLEPEKRILR